VENGSSKSLSNNKAEFKNLKTLWSNQVQILGLTAAAAPEAIGTMIINLEHDEGQENVFEIDDCYYSPSFNARIMCPQQWAEQRFDKYNDTVPHCDTTRQNILEWSHAG